MCQPQKCAGGGQIATQVAWERGRLRDLHARAGRGRQDLAAERRLRRGASRPAPLMPARMARRLLGK